MPVTKAVEFCPPGLDPMVVLVLLSLFDYGGLFLSLYFLVFFVCLVGNHSIEVPKEERLLFVSPMGRFGSDSVSQHSLRSDLHRSTVL